MPARIPLRVLVAGAGLMGRWHAHEAAKAGARVIGIADPSGDAATRLARRQGAKAFSGLSEALAALRPDAVHVTTPLEAHERLVLASLDAGAHVLCEKPLGSSAEITRRLFARAAEAGRLLVPVHQFPFQRGVRRILAQPERLGRIVRVAFSIATAGGDGRDEAGRREVLLELLPHAVSLVRAFRLDAPLPAPDAFAIRLSTSDALVLAAVSNGVAIDVTLSLVARPTAARLEVWGTRARAHIDLFHGFSVLETGQPSRLAKAAAPFLLGSAIFSAAGANLARRVLKREPAYPGLGALIQGFYAAVAGRASAPILPEEAIESALLAESVRGAFTS